MLKLYPQNRLLLSDCFDQQKLIKNGRKSNAFLLLILFFTVHFASAQINANFNFENSMQGWTTTGYGEFAQTNTSACGIGNSTRANVYFNSTNILISPSLGTTTAAPINMTFDYKVLDYETLAAAAGNQVDIKAQWSNSAAGPWTTFFTVNLLSHIPSSNCTTKTATFTPAAGPLFVRFQNKAVGANSDIYYYFDNITFTEGNSTSCAPPSAIAVDPSTVTANAFTLSWIAPSNPPSLGYDYEIRSSGVAASGPIGLAASGTVEQGVTFANVTGLTPNTTYIIFVRSKCSSNDFSSWSSLNPITTLCLSATIPYTIPLSSAVLPDVPSCVTMENVNTDDRFWKTVAPIVGITGKVMQYTYNYAMPADDWFFTPLLTFTAGTSYRIAFKYKVSGYQEKLKVALGQLPAADAMSTTLLDLTIPSTTLGATQQYIDFTVPSDGDYSIGFQAHSNANSNILHLGEISVNFGPTCIPPTLPTASNVNKNAATISWNAATIIPQSGYVYEVRTSGNPGSGPVGLASTGTVASDTTTLNLENLESETDYRIYIASQCSGQDKSTWTVAVRIKTLCDYLELQPANDTVCQGQSATLQITDVAQDVKWYLSQDSSESIYTGNVFTTPQLQETTTYFAQASVVEADQNVKVGSGDQISQGYQNPFFSTWSNNHTQHIIQAQELKNQDMIAGPINSVALAITNAGSLPMIGLTIKIGTTSTAQLSQFIENSNFATVFMSPSYMPVLGSNIFQFTTPFEWDGFSNIVLEFCHGNPNASPTMNRGVLADDTEYISTIKANYFTATETAGVCANTTSNVVNYSNRPLFVFSATISCQNPQRTEVVALVNPVQPIIAEPIQTLTSEAMQDATLANLQPAGPDILWFATAEDALSLSNELPITTQLQSNTTYYAIRFENDCYSSPFAVLVTVQLGVTENSLEHLKVYPNPAATQITVANSHNISKIEVSNLIGQKLLHLTPNNSSVNIDLSALSSATYLLKITTAAGSKTLKIVKL